METANEAALAELAWSVEMSLGKFSLLFACCNDTRTRDRLLEGFAAICPQRIRILELSSNTRHPYSDIRQRLGEDVPDVSIVVGLEAVKESALTAMNSMREEFRQSFPFPLLFWITDKTHRSLIRVAPDFESWGTTTKFESSAREFVEAVDETANCWFRQDRSVQPG
ncbi:hypothetical protein [Baaleninema simplex]|uniref:hypothetical protein n=1 Tax=Baaleninema simplex TaxID=2862350 RepID=UPI0003603C7C|nr:hypothetical protein [Baaleninema simplex]